MAIPLQAGPIIETTVEELYRGILIATPRAILGIAFLGIAYLFIRVLRRGMRTVLMRIMPDDQDLVVDLAALIVSIFLWFGALLTLLNIVGMGDVAASLGTAAGFIALGVAYALSNMIADTVAGVYLLRDPDFEPGDTVTADGVTGEVRDIGIRKSRIVTDDGDTVVLANRDVDKKWTRRNDGVSA